VSDSLQRDGIVLPADGQRSFEELRESYREANRQRIHQTLRKDSLVRYHKDGTVAGRLETGLMTDAPAGHDWRTMKDFMTAGNAVPEFTEEFKIVEGAGLDRELDDLLRDVNTMQLHEGVKYPNANPEEDNHADTDQHSTAADDATTT